MKNLPLRLAVMIFAIIVAADSYSAQTQQTTRPRPPDPTIEVYIPTGMPVQIEVTRDERETEITKLNIKRIVGPDVKSISLIEGMIGPEFQKDAVGHVTRYTTDRVSEPASAAWASSVDVRRFIIIVERLETDTGVWVMESDDQVANVKAIVEHGNAAVPRAKFLPKSQSL